MANQGQCITIKNDRPSTKFGELNTPSCAGQNVKTYKKYFRCLCSLRITYEHAWTCSRDLNHFLMKLLGSTLNLPDLASSVLFWSHRHVVLTSNKKNFKICLHFRAPGHPTSLKTSSLCIPWAIVKQVADIIRLLFYNILKLMSRHTRNINL